MIYFNLFWIASYDHNVYNGILPKSMQERGNMCQLGIFKYNLTFTINEQMSKSNEIVMQYNHIKCHTDPNVTS